MIPEKLYTNIYYTKLRLKANLNQHAWVVGIQTITELLTPLYSKGFLIQPQTIRDCAFHASWKSTLHNGDNDLHYPYQVMEIKSYRRRNIQKEEKQTDSLHNV